MAYEVMMYEFIDTSEWKFVTSTTTALTTLCQYCWMTFDVTGLKDISLTVRTVPGASTTADIMKMSPSRVTVRSCVHSLR